MKNQWLFVFFSFLLLTACRASEPPSATEITVTMDESVFYQTIQGFGGFGAQKVWWADEPFYSDEFVDLLINDLGVSILRDNIPIAFEPINDNDDPYLFNWSGFNMSEHYPGADSHLGEHFPYLKAMNDAGLDKLIVSIWSPPLWMKHNDHRGNGSDTVERRTSAPPYTLSPEETTNQLRTELYEEFAEYCVAYISLLKRETGIDLYAISLQNEPRFSQFYASAVHSPDSLRDLIKVVGTRFEYEDIDTKIFMPEDVQDFDMVSMYLDAVFQDPEARRFADIVAIHNYRGDGVQPSDPSPQRWMATADIAVNHQKEIWMTETSGFDPDRFEGGMALAKSIYNALEYGQVSAWIYWQMSGRDLLDKEGEKTHLYYISQQFYRHIRPGTKRIELNVDQDGVYGLAFKHPANGKQTIVLINDNEAPVKVKLEGTGVSSSYASYLTSSNHHHELVSGFHEEVAVIPEKAVVTFVSD